MAAGKFFIKVGNGAWWDAYNRYGISLEDGALNRILTPAPHKEPVTNKNVLSHGVSVVQNQFYKDVRDVSLEMHLIASNKTDFMTKYNQFCSEVLDAGYFKVKTEETGGTVFHFLYKDCTSFQQVDFRLAKFTLTLQEPNPSVRQ